MNKKLLLALLLCAAGAFAKDGFKPLFNGKNLDGWDGDPRLWKAQDGMIVGSTEGNPLKYNSFLATKKSYANFILRAQAKLRNHNSGIQFRSELIPELKWAVRGYQADMAENNYWGCGSGPLGVGANGCATVRVGGVRIQTWATKPFTTTVKP